MATYKPGDLGIDISGYGDGAWIQGRQLWNGTLSDPGVIHPDSNQQGAGQAVSSEVNQQSATQQGVSIEQFDSYLASDLNSPTSPSYTSGTGSFGSIQGEVDKARQALQDQLNKQKQENDQKMQDLKKKEQDALSNIDELTQPFREDIEKKQREDLNINKNFQENQRLIDELDSLLTQGNNLIEQQQSVTGLASVRNPRIQKTMDDVAARAGVIQAVINARNGQIAVAENLIDRTIGAIEADRQDRINYYQTIISLNRQDILSLDEDSKRIAGEEINILKNDLDQAQQTATYIKQLMINPSTAGLMGQAGVSLNDSVDVINQKLAKAEQANEVREMNNAMEADGYTEVFSSSGIPANELVTLTDSNGKKHYYRKDVIPKQGSTAQDFILRELSRSSSTNTSSNSYSSFLDIVGEVSSPQGGSNTPQMTPASGIGSRYTDPVGNKWVFTGNGWGMTS